MIGLVHVAIQFPLYEHLKEEAKKRSNQEKLSTSHILFASSLSKAIASVTAYPHEVLRSRLQDHEHSRKIQQAGVPFEPYSNLREAIRSIWNQEGVRGFYRGLSTNLIKTVPAAVITLLTYEMTAKTLRNMFDVPERSS
jgi:solute carrier family 25 folate transporter 32